MLRGTEIGMNRIGTGAYGIVYKYDRSPLQPVVAVKIYKTTTDSTDHGIEWDALREIVLLRGMRHNNIIQFSQALFDPRGIPWCVLEFASGGTLANLISNVDLKAEPDTIARLTGELFSGLEYLHCAGVVHRDIKPANLLLCGPGRVLKIADFGCSHVNTGSLPSYTNPDEMRTDPVTTLTYRAPEVVFGVGVHGPALDIWAAGLILVEMLTGKGPAFLGARTDSGLMHAMCAALGTPTFENDLMPSMSVPCKVLTIHPPCDAVEAFLPRGPGTPQWGFEIVRACVCLEPTRRPTARWVLQTLRAPRHYFIPMEYEMPKEQIFNMCAVRADIVAPCPPSAIADRCTLALWLFSACVRLRNDSSRRVFHRAIYALDRLVGIPTFREKYMSAKRSMAAAATAIACLASKLCETGHVTLESLRNRRSLQGTEYAALYPSFTLYSPTEHQVEVAERDVLQMLDWALWGVVAYDIEAVARLYDESVNKRLCYTTQYAIDVILCSGGGCGHSYYDVVSAGFWVANSKVYANDPLKSSSPCNIPDLVAVCINGISEGAKGPLYAYYAYPKRMSVSILCDDRTIV